MTPAELSSEPWSEADAAAVRAQLGREARGAVEVAHRCDCGLPDVVTTSPTLPDGSPFPTTFYLTCPRLASAISTLESAGVMRAMQERLGNDELLAQHYRAAHLDYLARRDALGPLPEAEGVSAGGMPDRVKCLHALVAHSLAAGPGVNPLGDEALTMLAGIDRRTPCATVTRGTRVAAIDCGTNSIRLLVADVVAGAVQDIERTMEIVRLGEGVDRTGRLSDAALERTFAVVDRFALKVAELRPSAVRFVATSASRDAANRDVFVAGVRDRLGVAPEVISGDEEARLSFAGALSGLSLARSPVLVFDIGGGSTEFVLGDASPAGASASASRQATSVDIGCVRMAERHFLHDPPLPAEVRAARDDIDAAIRVASGRVQLRRAQTLVGVAGTVTTVAAMALGLAEYDAGLIHGAVVEAADVHRITEELLYMTRERRAAVPVMHPGRVDVIAAGALVLSAIVAYCGAASVVAGEHDMLDGLALELATRADQAAAEATPRGPQ